MAATQKIFKILESLNECVVKIAWIDRNTEGVIYWGDDGLDKICLNLPLVLSGSLIKAYTIHQQPNYSTIQIDLAAQKAEKSLRVRELKRLGQLVCSKLGGVIYQCPKNSFPTSRLMQEILRFYGSIKINNYWLNKQTYSRYHKGYLKISLNLIIAEIFIHEWLHRCYPEAEEELIIAKTRNKIRKLSKAELTKIAQTILEIIK